ncbi:MAG: hypothetical protein KXJ61_17935 [Hydrogenophaga sp.]|jgi:hypothetical protein|uniref:hypothetical protein n=1 Tax=Hydrogenophaga sp. TaxID=1904254 RepID=UPI001DE0DCFD|nr:hypothetical protein [Hydrogenophaga sp.]MBW0172102.1 hypothetical protein [Hydrogenophaga sp.]MBW0182844.1 hypothetical protein [Hydrogenophaga sp.]
MNQSDARTLRQATDTLAQDIWEFQALAEHLNEPDNPTPLALVLRRHADRLQASYEVLDVLLSGGMGAMAPMATQKPESPIDQFAAQVPDGQLPRSCHG